MFFRYRLLHRAKLLRRTIENNFNKWSNDGTLHEVFCFGALVCFSFSIITMANLVIEMEYAKRGLNSSKSFWHWNSWAQMLGPYPKSKHYTGAVTSWYLFFCEWTVLYLLLICLLIVEPFVMVWYIDNKIIIVDGIYSEKSSLCRNPIWPSWSVNCRIGWISSNPNN